MLHDHGTEQSLDKSRTGLLQQRETAAKEGRASLIVGLTGNPNSQGARSMQVVHPMVHTKAAHQGSQQNTAGSQHYLAAL